MPCATRRQISYELSNSEAGPFGLTKLEIEAAFMPDIEDSASNVVAVPSSTGKGWDISGDTTVGTELVATFSRALYEMDGRVIARHISLQVEQDYRNEGYAKALMAACFPLYQRLHVPYVELVSVGEGTMVWAKLGWSIHGGPSVREVHDEVRYTYAWHNGRAPRSDYLIPVFGPALLLLKDEANRDIGEEALARLAMSSRELAMRLHLTNENVVAGLRQRRII
jgi:GNAT superfamily N-acetyltransferase